MKIKLFYAGVFTIALFLGYSSVIPFQFQWVTSNAVKGVRPIVLEDVRAKLTEDLEVFGVGDEFFEESQPDEVEILETGEGWSLEKTSKIRSGDRLLGLFYLDGKAVLKFENVKINNRGDVTASINGEAKPRFLIKNNGLLRPGKVETVYSGFSSYDSEVYDFGYDISSFDKNFERKLFLEDTNYTLSIKKGLSRSKEKVWVLILDDGTTSQIINYSPYADADEQYLQNMADNLLWAGDLDHDKKLDLYIEFYNEKGGAGTGLFLSSKAEKGNLVKLVGRLWAMGC